MRNPGGWIQWKLFEWRYRSLRGKPLSTLLQLLGSASEQDRYHAAVILGARRDKSATDALIERLADPDEDVRERVIAALGKIGDSRAVEPLLALLEQKRSRAPEYERGDLGALIADSLGEIRDHRAYPALIELLRTGALYERRSAARALGRIGDETAVPALLKVLDEDAVSALGWIGDPRAFEPLFKIVARNPKYIHFGDHELVHRARTALTETVPRVGASEVAFLVAQLQPASYDRVYEWDTALWLLTLIGGQQVIDALEGLRPRLQYDWLERLDRALAEIRQRMSGATSKATG